MFTQLFQSGGGASAASGLNLMNVMAETGERGVLVEANATKLTKNLSATALDMFMKWDMFNNGDVTIDSEDVTLTKNNLNPTIARAANSTTAIKHKTGAMIRKKVGATVLSHTIAGTNKLAGVLAKSNRVDAIIGLEIDDTLKNIALVNEDYPEAWFGLSGYQPAAGTVIKVIAWLDIHKAQQALFWASIHF